MAKRQTCHIGVDVSKATLDVAVLETGEVFQVANTETDLPELVKRIKGLRPALIVMEASGGYERNLLFALIAAGLPAVRANAMRVHHFARATGQIAKTDAIDAMLLARFAAAVRPRLEALPTATQLSLQEQMSRRQALIEMLTMESNRLRLIRTPIVKQQVQQHIDWLKAQLNDVDGELKALVDGDEAWRELDKLLESVPGVGRVAATTLLAMLPELGRLTRREIAALVGVAPFNYDSGRFMGQRHIRGGRAAVRTALYMCAVAGLRVNPVLRECYDRLRSQGKPAKVALIACVRKLLVILNAMVRDQRHWRFTGAPIV